VHDKAIAYISVFTYTLWMLACRYSYQFRCGSGECIYDTYRCDGRVHCRDGSDEICSLYSHLFVQLLTTSLPVCQNDACAGLYIILFKEFWAYLLVTSDGLGI